MFFKNFFIIICLFECYLNVKTNAQLINPRLSSRLYANGIVPDVIDTVPQNIIRVQYPRGVEVDLGNRLLPASVKEKPSVKWPVVPAYYTLIMLDPDAPSRKYPFLGQINHWLVINIPGTQISEGETLATYMSADPSKYTGLHRYVFLVFKQNGIINHSETPVVHRTAMYRLNFKIRDFAKKYHLGQPIAANFFEAQHTFSP